MTLRLYNTLTHRKEAFEPLEPGKVRMYNCGPTVYSYAHIGNFASFLMADLLRRYLEYSGYEVHQVMNITDVGHLTDDDVADSQGEDKLEKKAREQDLDPFELARTFEDAFHEDRKELNLVPAQEYPRATEHIPHMIELIEELLTAGFAYESAGQVYYEIAKFPRYGILSGNTVDDLVAGHRVEEDPNKRSPLDFTLWKKDPKHLMQWDSPWGRGFPGWHIECSAMSRAYLGVELDIHTGGEDNIFPHHECEIAQSCGGGDRIFSRFWLHRRHILVEGKKMSKSLGNFFTVRDLLGKGHTGLEIRLALLGSHYRTNSNFGFEGLEVARKTLRYLREFCLNMAGLCESPGEPESPGERGRGVAEVQKTWQKADEKFRAAFDDDLNVSAAMAVVHGFVGEVYRQGSAGSLSPAAGATAVDGLRRWDGVLGVLENPQVESKSDAEGSTGVDQEIEALVRARDEARASKDWAEADRLRDLLKEQRVVVKDSPQGTRWHREV